ncbi:MAG TPA: GNAT family N-acetyltransferase [Kofleriaceae bacterium]|jgi:ribosomal protein S18 acetylase RimI-like enzyme|nr:GNAT family N-acetyltransferase [Kofleriaceae bacterium]
MKSGNSTNHRNPWISRLLATGQLARVRKNAVDFGWPAALHAAAHGAIKRFAFVRVLQCVQVCEVDADYLALDPRFEHGFLDTDTLRRFSADPRYDLAPEFLDEASAKGDQCYGILDGDRLVSFGWYSMVPTKISDDLRFCFDQRYMYMYKGFTDPDYRGQRLHARGMTLALHRFRERGARGLVSYVDTTNFDSLRSCYRMGYSDVGKIYCLRAADHYWIHADAACRSVGVAVEEMTVTT